MKKIFVINGAQAFAHSGAQFNNTILEWDKAFFNKENGFELQFTNVDEPYDLATEVEKYVWADVVIYHTPIWWFALPHSLKAYIDKVFTQGHRTGLYYNDGRNAENPAINYGKGGSLHGRNYMLTTTWNAPETAFTLEGEFFDQKSVDQGVMFGFHKMNSFIGMDGLESFHFHDVMKNGSEIEAYRQGYVKHLEKTFKPSLVENLQ